MTTYPDLTAYLENLETSDVQYTNEVNALEASGKGFITLGYQPAEHTVIDSLRHGAHRVVALVNVHTLGYELSTDLDLRLGDVVVEITGVEAHHLGYLLTSLFGKKDSYSLKR